MTIRGPSGPPVRWKAGFWGLEESSSISLSYPRPDLAQMRPFKPTPYSSTERWQCVPHAVFECLCCRPYWPHTRWSIPSSTNSWRIAFKIATTLFIWGRSSWCWWLVMKVQRLMALLLLFQGPFVNVDDLMGIIMDCRLRGPASRLEGKLRLLLCHSYLLVWNSQSSVIVYRARNSMSCCLVVIDDFGSETWLLNITKLVIWWLLVSKGGLVYETC